MTNKLLEIKIESILGGISSFYGYSKFDQYMAALGVYPLTDSSGEYSQGYSGFLNPLSSIKVSGVANSVIMWIETNPKDANAYVYDAAGSVFTMNNSGSWALTGLGDLNDPDASGDKSAHGNGCAYYDNYIYF